VEENSNGDVKEIIKEEPEEEKKEEEEKKDEKDEEKGEGDSKVPFLSPIGKTVGWNRRVMLCLTNSCWRVNFKI
jgi:hypothetical protein